VGLWAFGVARVGLSHHRGCSLIVEVKGEATATLVAELILLGRHPCGRVCASVKKQPQQ
jgi:hypothetical protein